MLSRRRFLCAAGAIALLFLATVLPALAGPGEEVLLADRGRALLSVVVGQKCGKAVRSAAEDLALYLGRISGAPFEVKAGDGAAGIVVGLPGDFGALPVKTAFEPSDPRRCEEYLLQSDGKGLYLIGATETAVEDAVWDLLYRLGYRQFFPGRNWEIIPSDPSLGISINVMEKPSFLQRKMYNGSGSFNGDKWLERWLVRNRVRSGFDVAAGYLNAYVLGSRELLKSDPESIALVGGRRLDPPGNLCFSNKKALETLSAYAIGLFKKSPSTLSVSLSPNGGSYGWCECSACAKAGNPSEMAVKLSNALSENISQQAAGKSVGLLVTTGDLDAYPPSRTRVAANVAVTMRTGLLSWDYASQEEWYEGWEELLSGWKAQGAQDMGLLAFVGGPAEDACLPVRRAAREFAGWHSRGVNRLIMDIGEYWGSCGLGNYLLSRVLWKVAEAEGCEALLDDFFAKAFGPAAPPMKEYFRLIIRFEDKEALPSLSPERLVGMYASLDAAMKLASTDGERTRVGEMAVYTRIMELRFRLQRAVAAGKKAAEDPKAISEEVMKLVYRSRESGLVNSMEMFANPGWYGIVPGSDTGARVPEGKNPWKVTAAPTMDEIRSIIKSGMAK